MDDAPVGGGERSRKPLFRESTNRSRECRSHVGPAQHCCSIARHPAERVEAKADVGRGRLDRARGDDRRKFCRQREGRAVELDRNARIKVDAVENAPQRGGRRIESEPMGAGRARERQRQTGGAVLKVLERLLVCSRRVAMVDALYHLPGRAGRPPVHGVRIGAPGIERLDPQAVMGLGDELAIERRALEHSVDKLAPLRERGWRKFGGKRHVGHGFVHATKMPWAGATTNRGQTSPLSRGGSMRTPVLSNLASASLTLVPAMIRSGAIWASGTSTNGRSNRCGWGRCSSG